MLMSCPLAAFVAGVKMGSGSRSDSRRPGGSEIPQTVPAPRYSFQPDPARYPRATHSMSMGRRLARQHGAAIAVLSA